MKFQRTLGYDLRTQCWFRILAAGIDLWIIHILLLPIVIFLLEQLAIITPPEETGNLSNEIATAHVAFQFIKETIVFGIAIIYFSLLESSPFQATFGKWFMRMRVVDKEDNRITIKRALLRNLIKPISALTIIGIFIIDMLPKRQALHDIICRTYILKR